MERYPLYLLDENESSLYPAFSIPINITNDSKYDRFIRQVVQ